MRKILQNTAAKKNFRLASTCMYFIPSYRATCKGSGFYRLRHMQVVGTLNSPASTPSTKQLVLQPWSNQTLDITYGGTSLHAIIVSSAHSVHTPSRNFGSL